MAALLYSLAFLSQEEGVLGNTKSVEGVAASVLGVHLISEEGPAMERRVLAVFFKQKDALSGLRPRLYTAPKLTGLLSSQNQETG